jgi:hypothetical protein
LPALAIVNLKPGNQTNPINTPNSGSHSSLVNPVLIPTLTTLILGTVSDADSAPLPGRTTDRPNNRILSIKLPVSSTGGLPSIPNVTVDYAVESSPPATGVTPDGFGYSITSLLPDSKDQRVRAKVSVS